jgi:hypothetical protein
MDWGAFTIGFGGLALGGWAQWLAHKERVKFYRERLYEKQFECFAWLADSVGRQVVVARDFLLKNPGALSTERRSMLRHALNPLVEAHTEKMFLFAPFIPSDLAQSVHSVAEVVFVLTVQPRDESRCDKQLLASQNPRRELELRYSSFVQTLRKHVGVDSLSKETLELLGQRD